jgi:hypothetical protein
MTKINDLTIEELIKVAESGELSPDQEKKVKAYAIARMQEAVNDEATPVEEKKVLKGKISTYKADIYGVMDMGYPYAKNEQREVSGKQPSSHVDMYCASEPL